MPKRQNNEARLAAAEAVGDYPKDTQPRDIAITAVIDRDAKSLHVINPTPDAYHGVRIWLKVTNPNAFGFTLSTLDAALSLEGSRAAAADFPLGLPLSARQESVIPLDLAFSFADLPGLAGALRKLAVGARVPYELNGTVGVNAGRLGTPTFGPMLLTRGEMRIIR